VTPWTRPPALTRKSGAHRIPAAARTSAVSRLMSWLLAEQGAELTVSDLDPGKRAVAERLGARWVEPDEAYRTACDVLVPAALGGVLDPRTVPELSCEVICGPANNQLISRDTADVLAAAGILWAPDFLVNAGGLVHGVTTEFLGGTDADVAPLLDRLADTLTRVLDAAAAQGITPLAAAERIAADRLATPVAA
jgi:leucine dehydrogenase